MPKFPTGYTRKALTSWAKHAQTWAQGGEPVACPILVKRLPKSSRAMSFMFFINGAKEHAPAAAGELLKLLNKKLSRLSTAKCQGAF
jgi:uncharacterized protein YecE (DUF72 family)